MDIINEWYCGPGWLLRFGDFNAPFSSKVSKHQRNLKKINGQWNIENYDKGKQTKIFYPFLFAQKFSPKSSPTINLSIKSLQTTCYKLLKKKIFTNYKILTNEFPFTKSHELKQNLRSEVVTKKCSGKKLFLKFENVINSHFLSRF